jgi:hypothetical protein
MKYQLITGNFQAGNFQECGNYRNLPVKKSRGMRLLKVVICCDNLQNIRWSLLRLIFKGFFSRAIISTRAFPVAGLRITKGLRLAVGEM